ncbi:HAD family hydrolase [Microbacterium sp.]|jgi:HAD superfamily hydrolase (TIGR01509 family)|uniref:HAD family hydrolase n=1 Tax=Microbacterium sp. TaxID=51671 RepID=UPI0037C89E86
MSPTPADPIAVLFDIDGTLVDSNYLHIDAWDRAFAEAGHPVAVWRIHRSIGMDSGKLLERLLGDHAADLSDAVKQAHARNYSEMSDRLRPFASARELLDELSRRGHRVVLATSAPQEELDALLAVLDVADAVDAVTSGEDVEAAKPEPDLVNIAVERAEVTPDRALLVGDSVWDIYSAARAGVRSIGVRSGGYSSAELLEAGAAAVYDDVADLLAHLEESPIVASTYEI